MTILPALLGSTSRASERCERLAEETCRADADGIDPTGYVLNNDRTREVRRIVESNRKNFEETAGLILNELGAASDIKLALEALKMDGLKICRAPGGSADFAKCLERLKDELVNTLIVDLSNSKAGKPNRKLDLEKFGRLVQGSIYNKHSSELLESINQTPDPDFLTRIENKMLPEIRSEIAEVMKRLLPDDGIRAHLLEQLGKVRYAGDFCPAELFGGNSLARLAQIGAFMEPDGDDGKPDPRIFVCRGMIGSMTSAYALTNIIAHEMTHSVDPCRVVHLGKQRAPQTVAEFDDKSPWSDLMRCLRRKDSVAAKNVSSQLPPDCKMDQVSEGVADFVAAEVVGSLIRKKRLAGANTEEILKGVANIWRIACKAPTVDADMDTHATLKLRIERILALQPDVRKALSCGPTPKDRVYCDANISRRSENAEVVR